MGEVAALAQVLSYVGVLKAIQEQVRFARARFDTYELIDFVAVLIGYAVSGESTLLADLANGSRHLPNRSWLCLIAHQLPHRSTFSRFLAALDQPTVEALRKLFQEDLVARKPFASPGGMVDRTGQPWWVVDVDGTRATARQHALPQTDALPAPHRRFDQVCAHGRLCGPSHTYQLLGTFGGPGTGITVGNCDERSGSSAAMPRTWGLLQPPCSCAWMDCMVTRHPSSTSSRLS